MKFKAEGRELAKIFEITGTIYANSERSEQSLVTESFFYLFLEVSQKIIGIQKHAGKVRKSFKISLKLIRPCKDTVMVCSKIPTR